MTDIFSKFSVSKDSAEPQTSTFEALSPGSYIMRPVAFMRQTSKNGNPQLVMRLKSIAPLSVTGKATQGTALWYITLSERAQKFVWAAVAAASYGDWSGNLHDDDDCKGLFLGKTLKAEITNTTVNGRTRARVERVHDAEQYLDDYPHDSPPMYWDEVTFSKPSNGSQDDTSATDKTKFFDDDIPF